MLLVALLLLSSCLPVDTLLNPRKDNETQVEDITQTPFSGADDFTSFCDLLFVHEVTTDSLTLNQLVADPAALGIEPLRPATLGQLNREATNVENTYYRQAQVQLAIYDDSELSSADRQLKELLEQAIEQTLEMEAFFYYDEPLLPSNGWQAALPLSLLEFNFRTLEDLEIYLEILADIPRFFDELIAFEQQKATQGILLSQEALAESLTEAQVYSKSDVWQAVRDSFVSCLNADVEPFTQLSEAQRQDYTGRLDVALSDKVLPAFGTLAHAIEALVDQAASLQGMAHYPQGKDYYNLTMRIMGFNEGASVAAVRLETALEEYFDSMSNGDDGLIEGSSTIPGLADLTQTPEAVLAFLAERAQPDFPAASSIEYQIKQVPEQMPNDFTMAYYILPPVDEPDHNVIYYIPKNISDDLEFYTTIAHEGIPGHMYQTNSYAPTATHDIQKALNSLAYMEGWAMYAQLIALDYLPASTAATQSYAAYTKFIYGLQARIDIGINFQDWDLDALRDYLSEWGLENSAEYLYTVPLKQPLAYLPYGLGLIEFFDLRLRAEQTLGATFILSEFHQQLIASGPVPFSVLESHFETWLNGQQGLVAWAVAPVVPGLRSLPKLNERTAA
ncbi:MAG: DUF885 domain-containing protein [Coriobacteriales bacterium]|nr:DUF885 domain-containing protein [Coriobacteriales bacterium]